MAYVDLFNDSVDEVLRLDPKNLEELKNAVLKMQIMQDLTLKLNAMKENALGIKTNNY